MLLKLVLLLGGICALSAEIVEIDCHILYLNCVVDELPEQLPANATWKFLCPQNCTRIQMRKVNFPRFPRELWTTNQQVTYLLLEDTDFEELAFGDFINAAKLTSFTLRYNKKFMSLRDNCFWGAFELISLDLYDNKISELEGEAFNGISLLDELNMQYNNITHISNDHFRKLPILRSIYLQFNTIETIESEAFLHNTNLAYLNIDSNKLTEVDLLLPLINNGTISIHDNQITKFVYRSISQEIEKVDNGIILYLGENKLTELYIQPNFAAERLFLLENSIERIDTLPVLTSLKLLNLGRCKIKSLDGQRFANRYANLRTLYMNDNNLASFSKETFAGLYNLETLALNNNELTEVDFPRLRPLTSLDLRYNRLTEFPYGEDIRNTFPSLKSLDIRNNDFGDEYLAGLVKTLEGQGITVSWEPES